MKIDDVSVRREVQVDGARIVYADAGSGDAVLLLHGYPQSRLCWRHQFEALARGHRVIAPDWLGWGESDRPLELSFRYDDEVERIGRFLDATGVSRASVVAHDYGAHLGVGFAARHPDRVTRLAILNSRAHRTFPLPSWLLFGAIGTMARTPGLARVLQRSPLIAIHRLLLARYLARGCFDHALRDRYVAWMAEPNGRRWFVRFFQDYVLSEPAGVPTGLGRLRIPVTIVWGDRDPYCPPRIAEDLARIIPGATLRWQRGADHFVMEERPREVLEALRELLDRPLSAAA